MDIGYPDYRLTDGAKAWVKRAKELGFRVGIWVNTTGVDSDVHPKLAERSRPGFKVIGHDATVLSPLKPTGEIVVCEVRHTATSESGGYLDSGDVVVVSGVRDGRLLVRQRSDTSRESPWK